MALRPLSLESFVKEANLHRNENRTFTVKDNGTSTRLSGRYFLRRVTQSQDSIETAIHAFKSAMRNKFDKDICDAVFAEYSNALDAEKVFGLTARTIKQVAGAAYLMRQNMLLDTEKCKNKIFEAASQNKNKANELETFLRSTPLFMSKGKFLKKLGDKEFLKLALPETVKVHSHEFGLKGKEAFIDRDALEFDKKSVTFDYGNKKERFESYRDKRLKYVKPLEIKTKEVQKPSLLNRFGLWMHKNRTKVEGRLALSTSIAAAAGTVLAAAFAPISFPVLLALGIGALVIAPVACLGARFLTWLGCKGVEDTQGWQDEGKRVEQKDDIEEEDEAENGKLKPNSEIEDNSYIENDSDEGSEGRKGELKGKEVKDLEVSESKGNHSVLDAMCIARLLEDWYSEQINSVTNQTKQYIKSIISNSDGKFNVLDSTFRKKEEEIVQFIKSCLEKQDNIKKEIESRCENDGQFLEMTMDMIIEKIMKNAMGHA